MLNSTNHLLQYYNLHFQSILNKITNYNLNDRLGHKPIETLLGVFRGIILTIIFNIII